VYVPPGYDGDLERRYPSFYVLQGVMLSVDMWRNRVPFRRTFPELVDRAMSAGECPPAIVVYVDCWTSLGGSQFVDSPGTGRYLSYLCDEVVPFVDRRYRTAADADHRGVGGHSSGGYGALVACMLRPDTWGGFADHAGDSLFELLFPPLFARSVRTLRDEYGGSFERYLDELRGRPFGTRAHDFELANDWCMAACWSADDDGTPRLPYDPTTGRLVEEVWARWLAWDPVRMIPARADALRGLRAAYVDAGRRDEYNLDLGSGAVRAALDEAGVPDVRFELFDDGHDPIEYRFPLGLRHVVERMPV
jgi:hypothetical protein